jgi:hypothetical protein
LRICGGGVAAARGRALQMSAETAATAMTPEEWLKGNGYGQPTAINLGGSGWASQYMYKVPDGSRFFVKTARQSADSMFKGEALGHTFSKVCSTLPFYCKYPIGH